MNDFHCPRCGRITNRPSLCILCLEKDNELRSGLAESHRLQAEAAAEQIAFERRRERDRLADRQREIEVGAARKVDELCEFAGTVGAEIQAAGSSAAAHTVLAARIAHRLRTLDLGEWQFLHQVSPSATTVAYTQLRAHLIPYTRTLWPHRDRSSPSIAPALRTIAESLRFSDVAAFTTIPNEIAAAEAEVSLEMARAEAELRDLRTEKNRLQGWVTSVTRVLPITSAILVASAAVFLFLTLDTMSMDARWSQKPGDKPAAGIFFASAGLLAIAGLAGLGLWWKIDPARWKTSIAEVQNEIVLVKEQFHDLQTKKDGIATAVVARWSDPQLREILDSRA